MVMFFSFFSYCLQIKFTFWFPRCVLRHPAASALEEWISTKDYSDNIPVAGPKWHVPTYEEVQFANDLLNLHFQSALDDLLKLCQTKIHSDTGKFIFIPLRQFSVPGQVLFLVSISLES